MKQILLMITSVLFLESCQSTGKPLVFKEEQCQTVLYFDDAGSVVSEKSFCRCRPYEISLDFIGARGVVTRRPLRHCNERIGYSVRGNTKLANFYESVRSEINADEEEFEKGFTGEIEESASSGADEREFNAREVDTFNHQEG